MKTSTIALLAVSGAATTAVYATSSCDLSTIQGSLLANGTAWASSCANATGVDVFALTSLPTKAEAQSISQSRDCVNYLNQLNQQANSAIQCETTVGDQTVDFAKLLTDLLTGKSSNTTRVTVVGSDSMSGSVSLSSSASTSSSESTSSSGSKSASASESSSTASEASASGPADQQEGNKSSSKSAGVAVTATFSVVAAAATAVLAFLL
ncbi:hypothetical protein PRNP1_006368 [Phytophthora ramorum]